MRNILYLNILFFLLSCNNVRYNSRQDIVLKADLISKNDRAFEFDKIESNTFRCKSYGIKLSIINNAPIHIKAVNNSYNQEL